jgi:hypothetical protein
MPETQDPGVGGHGHARAPAAVCGPYKDRFVNGQVAGVIMSFCALQESNRDQ